MEYIASIILALGSFFGLVSEPEIGAYSYPTAAQMADATGVPNGYVLAKASNGLLEYVANAGSGQTLFTLTDNVIDTDGDSTTATTSIKTNYIVATSTTATSTFNRLSVATAFNFLGTVFTDLSSFLFESELDTESELEAQLTDVTNVFTNNDTIDISDNTNLVAGTNITLAGDTLNVDDAFLLNTGDIGTGNYTFNGTTSLATTTIDYWLSQQGNLGLNLTDDGSDLILKADVGGVNSFFIDTDGTFLELVANPGPANDDLMFSIEETQGDTTAINFYEGGTGNNRMWNSGSMRLGGASGSTCATLTSDVDCDTSTTGADLVVQDDIWAGGKIFATDWTDVSITESQISDLAHYLDSDVSSYLYSSTTRSDLYTAGTGLSWTGTTLNAEVQSSDLHNAVTLAGEDYLSLATQQITANAIDPDNLSASDFGDFTCNGTTCSLDNSLAVTSWNLTTPTFTTNFTFDSVTVTGLSGIDTTVITGTAAGSGVCAEWNADGDIVAAASGLPCGAGGGSGSLSTSTDQIGIGPVEVFSYLLTDFAIGGASSTTAPFQFDNDGAQFILSSTTAAAGSITVDGAKIIDSTSGSATLDFIDVLGSTAEATFEAAIDTLNNLTSWGGFTWNPADAGVDAFFGWDDTANQYENLTANEAQAVLDTATDPYLKNSDTITHANIADSDQATTMCIYIEDPTADDDLQSIWANKTANDFLLTEIWAESDQTVAFDLQVDDGTPADVNGTDITPAAGEAEDTSLSGDTTVAAGEELDLVVTSATSTPTWVSICWTGNWVD